MLAYLYLFSILFSAVIAIICRKYLAGRGLIILIPFLWFTFIQETVLEINVHYRFINSTRIIYNIYRPLSAIVFFIIYFNVPFLSSLRRLMIILLTGYLLLVGITYSFIDSSKSGYLPIARGLLVTFFAVLFLLQYFNLDNSKEEKYWRPVIWITAGVAVFYSVVTTSLAFQNYLATQKATVLGMRIYQLIPMLLSIFMYSCFSYSFYLCKKLK